ncbi:MAG: hypothetical protein NHB32_14170 [Fischerella sp. CENA71]|nr:hypothetical protein [Fischerella sp. CENA71]
MNDLGITDNELCLLVACYAVCVEAAFESAIDFNRVIVALRMRSLLRSPFVET